MQPYGQNVSERAAEMEVDMCVKCGDGGHPNIEKLDKADMVYDLSAVWSVAKEVFPYFDRLPFDWDEQYRKYLGKVIDVEDTSAFHDLMEEFLSSLNDGHTKYIPPAEFRRSAPFSRPAKPSFSFSDGVLTIKINEFIADHSAYVRNLLEENDGISLVRLDIRDNIGGNTYYGAKVAELFISGVFHACRKWTQAYKASDFAGASQLLSDSKETLQEYIRNGLITENELEESRRIISRTNYKEYEDSWGSEKNKAIYDGPMEVLVSNNTISAAEDFAAMFRSNRRAVLIGEPTYGSTGTPCMVNLRCGGRAQVVSVGYRLLDGTEFIGKGIIPDVLKGQ